MKKYYLASLEEAFRLDESRSLAPVADLVLEQLQACLEAQDSADLMQANVSCLMTALQRHPTAFQPHFKDTVDILVGWHIDPSQPQWVGQLASRSLRQLRQFWTADAAFGVLLTGQFIEDMESYAQELVELDDQPDPDDETQLLCQESASKIVELIKVFTSVMVALGEAAGPAPGTELGWPACGHNLRVIVGCLLAVGRRHHSDQLVVTGCAALGHLVTLLGQRLGADVAHLMTFVDEVLARLAGLADLTLVAVCRLLETVLRHSSTVLPADLMNRLFGRQSPLRDLRLSPSEQVRSAVLATYHAALGLKNVPLLQDVYRHVLSDLHASFLALTGIPTDLVTADDVTAGDVRRPSEGLQLVTFSLQALAELASTRNSIIGLWALNPSIVDLLAVSLRPDDERLARQHPLVRHMVVTLLYSHCSKHRHFLSTSRLMRTERSTPALAPSTGHNLGTLLGLLGRLLRQPESLADTDRLCLLWTAQLVEAAAAGGYTDQLLRSAELASLTSAVAERATSRHRPLSELAARACRRLLDALGWSKVTAPLRRRLCEAVTSDRLE
ncbi:serine/threonine-protein kinase SMG1-like [Pollicipes pollicipes]|uniref:serine/threonine-protein kinase SMG1-like n=1 Tax=Pollicipes pollicipes TaxID=41117 RepID=UPI00188561A7|nr:serine/threonine-protein kinase SMG1-like [Pollicipes pollicipes]